MMMQKNTMATEKDTAEKSWLRDGEKQSDKLILLDSFSIVIIIMIIIVIIG